MRILIIFSFFVAFLMSAQAQSTLVGTWVNEDKKAHVEVWADKSQFQGKIIWLAAKKAQDKVGTQVFIDLKPKGKGWEGEVYSVKRDEIYPATFELKDGGNTLEIDIKVGFFSTTQTWTRLKP